MPHTAHPPVQAWFAGQPVTREEVLAWQARRAARALRRRGLPIPDGDARTRGQALAEAKAAEGREATERRLSRQVGVTDRIMRPLALASGRRRVLSSVELLAHGLTAARLPAWYLKHATADDEAVFLTACPDHHLFRPTPDGAGQEVWETVGGSPLASRFFFTPDETDTLATTANPAYPVQMAGTARLADGTVIGGLRHQFRDEPGGAVRALLTVEMPLLTGPAAPAAHRWHLAAEFSAWLQAAAHHD